jgi:hypothetical protein
MNFDQFLKKENVSLHVKQLNPPKKLPISVEVKDDKKGKNKQKRFFDENVEKDLEDVDQDHAFFNPNEFILKRGHFVTIRRVPRKEGETHARVCDMYAGYFAEITEIKRDIATVRLEATNNYLKIRIPIECLIKRDN